MCIFVNMKYLRRAVKYFLSLVVIVTLLMVLLVAFKVVDGDISTMFVNGYDSLWQIALCLAALSAFYPRFGYSTRVAHIQGSDEEIIPGVISKMEQLGYELETRDGADMTFRRRSAVSRALKCWEDRITFTRSISGYDIEGLTRDLVRIVSLLEDRGY